MKRIDYIGDGIGVLFTAIQTEQVFKIISLVITIISITVSLAYTLYRWYKDAKKDGKIDAEEIKEAGKEIFNSANKISEAIKSSKDSKEKEDNKDGN